MKASLVIYLLLGFGGVLQAFQQTATVRNHDFRFQAMAVRQEGGKVYLRGMVVVQTDDLEIRADEVEFNGNTWLLEARGNVSVRPTAASYLEQVLSLERADLAAMNHKFGGEHPEAVCTRRKIDALQLRIKDTATWSLQAEMLKVQLKRSNC